MKKISYIGDADANGDPVPGDVRYLLTNPDVNYWTAVSVNPPGVADGIASSDLVKAPIVVLNGGFLFENADDQPSGASPYGGMTFANDGLLYACDNVGNIYRKTATDQSGPWALAKGADTPGGLYTLALARYKFVNGRHFRLVHAYDGAGGTINLSIQAVDITGSTTALSAPAGTYPVDIEWTGSKWVMGTEIMNGASGTTGLRWSNDLTTWNAATGTNVAGKTWTKIIVTAPGVVYAFSKDGFTAVSTDHGQTYTVTAWTGTSDKQPGDKRVGDNAIVYSNGAFWSYSTGSSTNNVLRSTDGIGWTNVNVWSTSWANTPSIIRLGDGLLFAYSSILQYYRDDDSFRGSNIYGVALSTSGYLAASKGDGYAYLLSRSTSRLLRTPDRKTKFTLPYVPASGSNSISGLIPYIRLK